MSRDRPEWIGKTDDAAIPRLVKLRIWEREGGKCYLTGRKIMPGDTYEFEHRIALSCGGSHRESNIFLALTEAHKEKTASDLDTSAKIKRIHAKHNGYWPAPKRKLQGRGFPKREESR